jgi:hypothetical protein
VWPGQMVNSRDGLVWSVRPRAAGRRWKWSGQVETVQASGKWSRQVGVHLARDQHHGPRTLLIRYSEYRLNVRGFVSGSWAVVAVSKRPTSNQCHEGRIRECNYIYRFFAAGLSRPRLPSTLDDHGASSAVLLQGEGDWDVPHGLRCGWSAKPMCWIVLFQDP